MTVAGSCGIFHFPRLLYLSLVTSIYWINGKLTFMKYARTGWIGSPSIYQRNWKRASPQFLWLTLFGLLRGSRGWVHHFTTTFSELLSAPKYGSLRKPDENHTFAISANKLIWNCHWRWIVSWFLINLGLISDGTRSPKCNSHKS